MKITINGWSISLVRGPGVIDHQVVRAAWTAGQLSCDRLLGTRAQRLIDLGAEFRSDDPPRRYHASLQALRSRC